MRKISFSNVLQDKGGQGVKKGQLTQLNLHEMVEEFTNYPSGDFTLRYSQHENYHSANSNLGFEEGYNPLDQWMSSQIQNNKENIADTQPRRKIPNELLKYVQHTSKSPIQQNPNSKPLSKMMDMKQICKEYAENKKKGNNVQDNAPIWKFSSRQDSENEIDRRDFESEIKESLTAEKYKEQINLDQRENEFLSNEFSKLKKETIINVVKTLPEEAKGRNLSAFIEEIKNNLAQEIESMAERIIQDRKKEDEEDEELLISQRKSISNNEEERFEQARKEIGEYLNIKPCSIEREEVHYEKKTSLKAEGIVSFENNGKNGEAGVGYSFSSDLNSGVQGDDQIHGEVTQQSHYTLKSNQPNLPSSEISLANIDEIKSEKDLFEQRDDFIEDSMAVNYKPKITNVHQEIDKNFIKEIQSVAFAENQNEYKANDYGKCLNSKINHETHCISSEVKPKECPERNEFVEGINKNVKFIEDEQDVNISVAEDQPIFNQGSFKDGINTIVENTEKTDFKKMASPKRQNEKIVQASSPSNNIKSSNYFISNAVITPVYIEAPTETAITPSTVNLPENTTSSICQINLSNILETDQKEKEIFQANNASLIHNSVKMPLAENRNIGNQNSKERFNEAKVGSNENHSKLKITLLEKERQENIAIGDFKLAPMAEEGFTSGEFRKGHEYYEALGSFSTNKIRQSIGMTQEGKEGKLKLTTMFPHSNTVTEIRETREEIHKDNNKENTLIKISKYERTEVYVEQVKPKESIRSNVRGSSQFEFDLDF